MELASTFTAIAIVVLVGQHKDGLDLEWRVPCAEPPDVAADFPTATGKATATAFQVGDRWKLTVTFGPPGTDTHEVDAESCIAAAKTALLLLRLGPVHQETVDHREAVETEVSSLPGLPPEHRPEAEVDGGVAGSLPYRVQFSFGGVASVGTLIGISWRAGATLGVGLGRIAILAQFRMGGPARVPVLPGFVTIHPVAGGNVSGCFFPRLGRFRFGPCLGVAAEWWAANTGRSDAWVAVSLDFRAQLYLWHGLFAFLGLGPRFAVLAPRLPIGAAVYVTPPVSGEAETGLGWDW